MYTRDVCVCGEKIKWNCPGEVNRLEHLELS